MDFRRVFLAYLEGPNSILVKKSKNDKFINLPFIILLIGPIYSKHIYFPSENTFSVEIVNKWWGVAHPPKGLK